MWEVWDRRRRNSREQHRALAADQVEAILADTRPSREVAAQYGVSHMTILAVRRLGKAYLPD